MERFKERALVLSHVDYGDADRLVCLFTPNRGKLTAFAAGARRSQQRFAGALQSFMLVQAQLVERAGETFRLDGADVEQGFYAIRQDLALIARALYSVELCRELVRDREPHQQLFSLLVEYLQKLDQKAAGPSSLIAFELHALAQAGLRPRFDRCALCGGALGERLRFDPEHGGMVCYPCRARVYSGVSVSSQVVDSLRALQAGDQTPLATPTRRCARELLNAFISHHLGRKLKSVDFMTQVGLD
ncbi:MAG TPA: DNA repair protein RecO [Myxococcales bacterium]